MCGHTLWCSTRSRKTLQLFQLLRKNQTGLRFIDSVPFSLPIKIFSEWCPFYVCHHFSSACDDDSACDPQKQTCVNSFYFLALQTVSKTQSRALTIWWQRRNTSSLTRMLPWTSKIFSAPEAWIGILMSLWYSATFLALSNCWNRYAESCVGPPVGPPFGKLATRTSIAFCHVPGNVFFFPFCSVVPG